MKKHSNLQKSDPSQLGRKDKRKLLRKEKKEKKKSHYQQRDHPIPSTHSKSIKNNNSNQSNPTKSAPTKSYIPNSQPAIKNQKNTGPSKNKPHLKIQTQKKPTLSKTLKSQKKTKKTQIKLQEDEQLMKEEKQIEYYEKLLGVGKRKNKYKSIAKGMGYEDDLFDFLDGISKKVKGQVDENENEQNDDELNEQNSDELNEQNGDELNEQNGDESGEVESDGMQMDQSDAYEQQINGDQDQSINDSEMMDEEVSQANDSEDPENQSNEQSHQQQNDVEGQSNMYSEQQLGADDASMDEQQFAMWENLKNQQIPQSHSIKKQNQKIKQTKHNLNTQKSSNSKQQPTQNKPQKTNKLTNNQPQPITKPQQARRPLFGNMTQQQKEQQEIRKQMNGLFNKLSDGNLMISFRQFSQIFLSASKSNTIPVFINLFIKSNVEVQKPHLHILLSNIALASALHHLIGNRLMAPLVYELVKKFEEYEKTQQDLEEIQSIGYSKLFEKKKNIIIILSYLYDFKSLTGDFIHSLVQNLALQLNEHHVQFLYIIIQKIGNKIRQNDPGILKEIVDTLKQSIQAFKQSQNKESNQISKINIIQIELNELKFNRKQPLFYDQRMAFFNTFLSKNIQNQLSTQKDIILANYHQLKTADTSLTNWWENITNSNPNTNQQIVQNQQDIEMLHEITAERKKLLDLAKSLNLVTEIRKNIFIEIMQASDYIEATQRVLTLKIRNLQEISVVLLQVCVLQPTFNPFYPLVAAKIANLNPKFKSKVQFTIWDHIKLLDSYNPRKTSNLAKFCARFVGSSLSNASLSILKYFPDLINIAPHEAMFLMVFFTEFLSITKKPVLLQLSKKLKEEGNRQIKDSLLEYLSEVGTREKGFNNMEKMKFLRRMIRLNESENAEEQAF